MIRRPPRSTLDRSSAASDVYKRQKFVSETVLLGFKAGVALQIISTQLPKFCGFKGGHGNFFARIGEFVRHMGDANPAARAGGATALAVRRLGKRCLPNRPVALFVVVGAIVAA